MKLRLVFLLLFAFLPLGSSSIFIESLNPIYNYGDQLSVQTTIISSSSTGAHYIVDLECGTTFSSNIFNSFFNLQPNIERPVLVTTELLDPLMYNITEPCVLVATYGNEEVRSSSFLLSNKITVDAEFELDTLNPGNYLRVSGTAVKESGVPVNGFAEIFIPSLNLYKSSIVSQGIFNAIILLPSDSKSGEHEVRIDIHNTDYNSRKINFGAYSDKFEVNQILKSVTIFIDNDNPLPDSEFVFRVDAVDQAGEPIIREASLVVNKPQGVPFIQKVVNSGEDQKIIFFLNDTPGYWSIEATIDELSSRKLFYLVEVSTIQTSLINNTLIVTNVGNALYDGPLEITIGSYIEVKQIRLNSGETQKFTLRAPDGDYSISVLESGESKPLGSAFLTGNAVKVTDFREDVLNTFTDPLIWWLAVILLVLVIVLVRVKLKMQKNLPKPSNYGNVTNLPLKASPVFENKPFSEVSKKQDSKFDMSWFNKHSSEGVASSKPEVTKVSPTVLFDSQNQGIRERAVAIALYMSSNSPSATETLNRSLSMAQEVGAKVYVDGEYKIILFSPRLTKIQENEISAVNLGRRMQALLLEHIKLHNDWVKFGLGVADGEIISEIENGKFHFTSTGNLISYSKKIAFLSNSKLLVSESVRRKVISTVKTEKTAYPGIWEVVKVVDHFQSREFIKRFSDRNKQ
ncbi:MAG: hypothetical protein AABW89_06045 [Nanoarchaeota archaeon]